MSSSRFFDLATSAALIASILSAVPNYSQTTNFSPDIQKKNIIEIFPRDTPKQAQKNITTEIQASWLTQQYTWTVDHQKIVRQKIQDILALYGQEKGMEIIREHMLIEINTARAKISSPAMTIDTTLTRMAQQHAQDMANNDYLDHTDSQWRHVWDRAKEVGYQYALISENIANDETIQGVISGFVQSKMGGHERILSPEYTAIGFGVETYHDTNARSQIYFVLDFASPLK